MTTPMHLHILKSLSALEAAERLVTLSSYELKGICTIYGLKYPKRAEKQEMINLIISYTHPAPAPAPAPEQLSF